jgi:hypothetical protein
MQSTSIIAQDSLFGAQDSLFLALLWTGIRQQRHLGGARPGE